MGGRRTGWTGRGPLYPLLPLCLLAGHLRCCQNFTFHSPFLDTRPRRWVPSPSWLPGRANIFPRWLGLPRQPPAASRPPPEHPHSCRLLDAGPPALLFFFFFKAGLFFFFNLFIYGCVGSSFLCEGFLQLWQAGATLHRGARASHYRGLSRCGAQAPDTQAQ